MEETNKLKKRIKELEERIKVLEDQLKSSDDIEEKKLMDALFEKAEELVKKYRQASAIFLQKKLIIDFHRAKKLMEKLKKNGVI